MVTITAAEPQEQVNRYVREAQKEPLAVTDRGQDSIVLMSASEYRRLEFCDDRAALHAWELPDDLVRVLETAKPPAFTKQFDHEI